MTDRRHLSAVFLLLILKKDPEPGTKILLNENSLSC